MSRLRYKIKDDFAIGIFENEQQMIFDISDLELISSYSWFIDQTGYPSCCINRKTIRLHRLLISDVPKGMVVDHINRNKLDNRRKNLRVCTQKVNVHNASLRSTNTSGTTGVFFDKKAKRWRAQIYHNGKTKHVGIFDSFDDAVIARKKAEQEYYEGV